MKERLKELRKHLGLTMEEFGNNLGVRKTTISSLENGVNNITNQMAKLICTTYNVNEEWLKTGNGSMFNDTKESHLNELAKQYALDDMEIKIVEAFLELSPDKRAAIKEYASILAKSITEKTEDEIVLERIDKEVEEYRKELQLQARKTAMLSPSKIIAGRKKRKIDKNVKVKIENGKVKIDIDKKKANLKSGIN